MGSASDDNMMCKNGVTAQGCLDLGRRSDDRRLQEINVIGDKTTSRRSNVCTSECGRELLISHRDAVRTEALACLAAYCD